MKIMQMKADDFWDYASVANKGLFVRVPLLKLKHFCTNKKNLQLLAIKHLLVISGHQRMCGNGTILEKKANLMIFKFQMQD